jgi:hypothetical protein
MKLISQNDDKKYYNISINYVDNPSGLTLATFRETRVQPIVDKADDYYLSIIRFTIPMSSIPIFIMESVETQVGVWNPNVTPFSVTLVDQATNNAYQSFIIYDPDNLSLPVPTSYDPTNAYYYVYSYQHMLTMINNALLRSFNALKTAHPTNTAIEAPFFRYNPSGFISLRTQVEYSFATQSIDIYVNHKLVKYTEAIAFDFYGFNTADGRDAKFKIMEEAFGSNSVRPDNYSSTSFCIHRFNNTYKIDNIAYHLPEGVYNNIQDIVSQLNADLVNYTVTIGYNGKITITNTVPAVFKFEPDSMGYTLGYTQAEYTANLSYVSDTIPKSTPAYIYQRQEYLSLESWNSLVDMQFTTDTIPINYEMVQNNTLEGRANSRPILTDFEPTVTTAGSVRSIMYYYQQGPYRLINLVSPEALVNFDFQIWWKDKIGNRYPLYIRHGSQINIKIAFFKKSTFTS